MTGEQDAREESKGAENPRRLRVKSIDCVHDFALARYAAAEAVCEEKLFDGFLHSSVAESVAPAARRLYRRRLGGT